MPAHSGLQFSYKGTIMQRSSRCFSVVCLQSVAGTTCNLAIRFIRPPDSFSVIALGYSIPLFGSDWNS